MTAREYSCEYYRVTVPETSCLFCDHCTDVFWDFTHGPYMFVCELDRDTIRGIEGSCDAFEYDGYGYDQ